MYIEHLNLSINSPGNVGYIEEYYTIDSNKNPKYVGSNVSDVGQGIKSGMWYNISSDVLRPVSHGGMSYTLIKSVITLDNERIFEYWLTRNRDFIDNTDSPDDIPNSQLSELQNIDKYEVVEHRISRDVPVTFVYSALGVITEANVTGGGTDDLSLRIDLLKGLSSLTYNPGGVVYKYLDVKADSTRIKNISINYRVDNSWMNDRDVNSSTITMISWDSDNKVWVKLPTKIIDYDTEYTYYVSQSNNPSKLVILGLKSARPQTTIQQQNTTEPIKSDPPVNQTKEVVKKKPISDVDIILLVLLIIIYKLRKKLGD